MKLSHSFYLLLIPVLIFSGCKASNKPEVESWKVAKDFLADTAKASATYKDKELVFKNIAVWVTMPDQNEVDGLAYDPISNTIANNSDSTINGKNVKTSDTFIIYALLADPKGLDKLRDPKIDQIENKQLRHYLDVINVQGTFDKADDYSIYIKNAKIVD